MTVDEAKAGMTEGQKLRLDCALNLCKIAASIVSITGRKIDENDEEKRLHRLCTAGAIAETYVANILYLTELLRRKYDRAFVSNEETVAAWGEQYEWIVKNGLRPAIHYNNGIREVPLPFPNIHATAMEAYHKIIKFRKEIRK